MKARHLIVLLALALIRTGFAAPPFVYPSAEEFQSAGDFDGNGYPDLVILDRLTGAFRIGYQSPTGSYSWTAARASGVAQATGLGVGRLSSLAFDSLAATGPAANRVSIVDATNTAAAVSQPVGVFIPSLGPNACAVIDIGGTNNNAFGDLYVASCLNGASANRETLVRNVGTTNRTPLLDASVGFLRTSPNAVLLHTNRSPRLAVLQRGTADKDYFTLLDLSAGINVWIDYFSFPTNSRPAEYLCDQFIPTNAYTQILLYWPGTTLMCRYQVWEPTPGTYGLETPICFDFPTNTDQLFVVSGGGTNRLLAISSGGQSAGVYSFNGWTNPVLLRSFSGAEGAHFTGVGPDGRGGWTLYSAPLGVNVSTAFEQWRWDGAGYVRAASGDLPRVNAYSASGNVLQFQYEPFVTNSPGLLRVNNAGDWAGAPVFSGSPTNLYVRLESFLGSTQGLAGAKVASVGQAHPLARFALANQYSNAISLFSLNAPAGDSVADVSIAPPAGTYPAAIQLSFTPTDPTAVISYRVGNGGWAVWTNTASLCLVTNSTVQYYARTAGSFSKSPIRSASYVFTSNPGAMDTKGDGIPDYVKAALGLGLTGTADADGDGFTDLEELVRGTDPRSAASKPVHTAHLDDQAAYDIRVTLSPWDPYKAASTTGFTNTPVRAHDLQGSLLRYGVIATNTWPRAYLTNVPIIAENRLVTLASESHFSIVCTNADQRMGRELLSLTPVPALRFPTISNTYVAGNITNAANAWVTAASNALKSLPRGTLTNSLTPNYTLAALLFEQKVAQLLGQRGFVPWTNLTLFPFRVADLPRTNPPQAMLLALEHAALDQPGYLLQTIHRFITNQVLTASPTPQMTSLRTVARDIYAISARYNNDNPATFLSPVDELRRFLWLGTFDSNYQALATSSGQFSDATVAAARLLAAVPSRPLTNLTLRVRADTLASSCRLMDGLLGGPYSLVDSAGMPFAFPDGFNLLPGATCRAAGYLDLTNSACGTPAMEVVAVTLDSLPLASDLDSGNLLVDSWERQFFGGVGLVSPFADADDDHFSNLQEMLEGTDPMDQLNHPAGDPVAIGVPALTLERDAVGYYLRWQWPAAYRDRFVFGIQHTPTLVTPFNNLALADPPEVGATDRIVQRFTPAVAATHFYRLTISLR
jgi:hypothetical protein